MVVAANVWTEQIHVSRSGALDVAVSKVCEAVLVSVADVVVFESRLLDRLQEVDGLGR